ncbi:hypothetical protein CVT26_015581 [Gymnopilus dilepis]|uniref:Uncharacterized protein n=1 Tax=Gymnopilus dilepis TaxID=231916 RepID=A0A409XYT7_9AGAR|nr:hypothetical protein CVT26_015581 [Gymnopilus dilepis]
MFGLIRRISYGVIPRPDRPWEEDPTSNAPQRRKKRRLSSTERPDVDADEEAANKKKARGESGTPDADQRDATFLTPPPPAAASTSTETQEVKEVTQGVKEVDLDGKDESPSSSPAEGDEQVVPAPESVPLPQEKSGELDEASSDASTPPPANKEDELPSKSQTEDTEKDVTPAAEEDVATAEKGPTVEHDEHIKNTLESSISPAGVTVSQN